MRDTLRTPVLSPARGEGNAFPAGTPPLLSRERLAAKRLGKGAWSGCRAHAEKYRQALVEYANHANVYMFTGGRGADRFLETLGC